MNQKDRVLHKSIKNKGMVQLLKTMVQMNGRAKEKMMVQLPIMRMVQMKRDNKMRIMTQEMKTIRMVMVQQRVRTDFVKILYIVVKL